jgi:COP9 signalosome complex subunit 4
VVSDEVPLVVSRQLLQTFAQDLGKLESEAQKEVAHYALTQIQPRVVSFEEQVGLEFLLQVPAYGHRIL